MSLVAVLRLAWVGETVIVEEVEQASKVWGKQSKLARLSKEEGCLFMSWLPHLWLHRLGLFSATI